MACIFCDIASGKEKGWVVFSDDKCTVVLDAFPVTEGHMLLLPKTHYDDIFAVPEADLCHFFKVARDMAAIAKKNLECDGINITTAPAAIPHFHVHIIPRYDFDLMGPLADLDNKRELPQGTMDDVQRRLKGAK